MMNQSFKKISASGFSMIEILITIVILTIGLLGLAGLQAKATTAQIEGYQRSQALILIRDMQGRMYGNRAQSPSYIANSGAGSERGTGYNGSALESCSGTRSQIDLCEWHNALLGVAETSGTSNVGAMIGARGCIYEISSAIPRKYIIAVAWQGMNRTAAPSVNCGQNQYGGDDAFRRVITIPLTIGNLS